MPICMVPMQGADLFGLENFHCRSCCVTHLQQYQVHAMQEKGLRSQDARGIFCSHATAGQCFLSAYVQEFSKVPAEGVELLNCLLTYDPEKRMAARQALRHPFFSTSPLPQRPENMPSFPSYFDVPDSRCSLFTHTCCESLACLQSELQSAAVTVMCRCKL